MKLRTLAPLALLAAAPAFAGNLTLDFETVTSFASIDQLYAAQGVTFGLDALGLMNDELGPYFSNAPSPLGVMAPVGPDATMNVAAGFSDLSFFYSSAEANPGTVQVWSGLGGTGNLLASFSLVANAQAGGCSDAPYCHFSQLAGGAWGELAHSVTFGGAPGVGIDNVSITAVPEPASALLMACGAAALLMRRRLRG
jgi:hypothetical protein